MLKWFLVLAVLTALLAPALAPPNSYWDGSESDVWADSNNWTGEDPNNDPYLTFWLAVDPGPAVMPVITADNTYTGWSFCRIKFGASITQTGGVHEWVNGTGSSSRGIAIFSDSPANPSVLHMTGGTHTTDRLALGFDNYELISKPAGVLEIWGDAVFIIRENDFVAGLYDLEIDTEGEGNIIDIRENGRLQIPADAVMEAKVTTYAAGGRIVAGEEGKLLRKVVETLEEGQTFPAGDYLVITAVPDPGPWPDADADGDVDLADFGFFQRCLTTGMAPASVAPSCLRFDRDDDDDVDEVDLREFENCATGPGLPVDPQNLPSGCDLDVIWAPQ